MRGRTTDDATALVTWWATREGLLPGDVRLPTRKLYERFQRVAGDLGRVSYPEFRQRLEGLKFDVAAQWIWVNKKVLHAKLPE